MWNSHYTSDSGEDIVFACPSTVAAESGLGGGDAFRRAGAPRCYSAPDAATATDRAQRTHRAKTHNVSSHSIRPETFCPYDDTLRPLSPPPCVSTILLRICKIPSGSFCERHRIAIYIESGRARTVSIP